MRSIHIRAQIIRLREEKARNERIGCLLVANKNQRQIERLEKELLEIERKDGT